MNKKENPRMEALESLRAFIVDDSLRFARLCHGANPAQEPTAIFEFLRDAWAAQAVQAVDEAELLYADGGGDRHE